jgi:WD40 repeat protein
MATTTAALSLECSDQPLDLCFHPTKHTVVAAALVDGTVEVHDFAELLSVYNNQNANNTTARRNAPDSDDDDGDDEPDSIVSSTPVHVSTRRSANGKASSARCVEFSSDGARLYSGGSLGDFACVDAHRVTTFGAPSSNDAVALWRVPVASYGQSPLQLVKEVPMDPNLVVSGDEAGGVRVWDVRLLGNDSRESEGGDAAGPQGDGRKRPRGCVHSWKTHDDYVSGIDFSPDGGSTMLVCSADCTLSVYDLRKDANAVNEQQRMLRRSDDQEDELLSIKVIKNGRKVVCGTGEGVLAVWSYGTWGDVSDRFPGHPASVDALLKVDEDTLLTGSSDGLIRVVSIQPDKLLGVLGDHDGFPIEKLAMSADRAYVGSVTHDSVVRLFDATILKDDWNGETEDGDMEAADDKEDDGDDDDGGDDWEDMDDDSDLEDDDDDDDDGSNGGKARSSNDKRASRLKTDNERFFDDL